MADNISTSVTNFELFISQSLKRKKIYYVLFGISDRTYCITLKSKTKRENQAEKGILVQERRAELAK